LQNKGLLLAAEKFICNRYSLLIHRFLHVNMPPSFKPIWNTLKDLMDPQTILKSRFLETEKERLAREGSGATGSQQSETSTERKLLYAKERRQRMMQVGKEKSTAKSKGV